MIISVDRIPWEGLDLAGEVAPEILDLGDEADRLRVTGPVVCRLHARIVSREVMVRGELAAPVDFMCVRCGRVFSMIVKDSRFEEIYPFDDPCDTLDLTCDIRESIILAFPPFPLCAEECKGVCPQCGADRNRETCSCRRQDRDERWAALDGILPVARTVARR